jgi:hypothetical protein
MKKAITLGVIALLAVMMVVFSGCSQLTPKSTVEIKVAQAEVEQVQSLCPKNTDSINLILNAYNILNTTAEENYDSTAYVLNTDGKIVATFTDLSTPTAVSLPCGKEYKVVLKGDSTTNSEIVGIRSSTTNSAKVVNGALMFTGDTVATTISFDARKHGVLEFKLYDNLNARFAFDTGDTDATSYEADGVTFTDGDNATAFAVAAGGKLDLRLDFEGTANEADFQDKYTYIAVEADDTIWNDPSFRLNGAKLVDVSDSLVGDEAKKLSGYEFVYKFDTPIENDVNKLEMAFEAQAGQNPTADIEVDFFSAGNFKKTSLAETGVGIVGDDTARTVVHAVQDVTIDIS